MDIEDLIICLVALMDFCLWRDLPLGWVAMICIAFTARPRWPAKFDRPDPSMKAFWTDRARLFCPSGSNLGAGTCKNSDSAREWHQNTQISLFQQICEKTTPADFRLKPTAPPRSSRASPAAPRKPQSALKWRPGPSNVSSFRYISHDLGKPSLKGGSGVEFSLQNDPPDSQNLLNMCITAPQNVPRVSE